jgi:sugar phosphate isomerase/epimerase
MAASLGYAGLEVAPFTLSDSPHLMPDVQRSSIRRAASDAGVQISGLHWLLVTPKGLSVNAPDDAMRRKTSEIMCRLADLCADLEGDVLVHGSPAQRTLADDDDPAIAWGHAKACFAIAAEAAERAGVIYCVEALAPRETNFINTLADAARMVDEVDSLAFRTMLDTSAAGAGEAESPAALIERWMPKGYLAHIQVNDRDRRGPGQGEDQFGPVLRALKAHHYQGWIAVEPFIYQPDGPTTAARAIGYLQGLMETLP